MADKDMTRRAIESAARVLLAAKRSLRETIPYGPGNVRVTPAEFRRTMESASPDTIREILDILGPDQALRMLTGTPLNTRRPLSFEDYLDEEAF